MLTTHWMAPVQAPPSGTTLLQVPLWQVSVPTQLSSAAHGPPAVLLAQLPSAPQMAPRPQSAWDSQPTTPHTASSGVQVTSACHHRIPIHSEP